MTADVEALLTENGKELRAAGRAVMAEATLAGLEATAKRDGFDAETLPCGHRLTVMHRWNGAIWYYIASKGGSFPVSRQHAVALLAEERA